ncbi:MAG: zinc-binding dehydrogenase [Actinomycetes bacterium]
MEEALVAVSAGRMDVPIDEVMPLSAVNDAFDRIVARQVRGKLILDCQASR